MNHPQQIARVFGVLYLITFITSIPALFVFFAPVLDDPRYILGPGADTSVAWGAFLEMILIIAQIGTAVVVFPLLRRQNEILALGYVTARVMESVFTAVGIVSLLTIVTLRQEATAGADAASLLTAGESLVALQTRATGHGRGGAHRRSPDHRYGGRRDIRGHRGRGCCAGHRDHPGGPLGAGAGHMADREGIQYVRDRSPRG
jgi:hypothetical protein